MKRDDGQRMEYESGHLSTNPQASTLHQFDDGCGESERVSDAIM